MEQEAEQRKSKPKESDQDSFEKTPPTSGMCKDWFATRMMQTMHDMDVEDCIFQHLDVRTIEAIAKDEYVDINRLIDCDEPEDDNFQLSEGIRLYLPQAKLPFKINSFGMWCKAALVYMAAHQKYHPEKAAELLEYRASIEGFARTYPWVKVAEYDRKFRRNMAKKPWRHWGLINQTLVSKVLQAEEEPHHKSFKKEKEKEKSEAEGKSAKGIGKKKKGLCRRWNNAEDCQFGERCYYDHRCAVCGKSSHGAINCPRVKAGAESSNKKQWKETLISLT